MRLGSGTCNKGMLITTESRSPGTSPIKDLSETVQRLNAAQSQHEALAKLAQSANAQDANEQTKVAGAIKIQNHDIQSSAKGRSTQLGKPHIVLASPSGIETSTAGSTHMASDQYTALTTGLDYPSLAAAACLPASDKHCGCLYTRPE